MTLLREEGIKNIDAFISVTHSSETNILSCLLAKKMGVKKSVAEVENIDYIDLAENIGIGTLINTKLIVASHIYRYTMNVDVKHLKFLTFSEAEVFEMEAETVLNHQTSIKRHEFSGRCYYRRSHTGK